MIYRVTLPGYFALHTADSALADAWKNHFGGTVAQIHLGDIYHEISGPSPRGNGVYHAVVGRNGEVVHDPHPSRAGLAGDPATWEYCYLVKAGGAIPTPDGGAS